MEPQHGLGQIREVCALELWIQFRLQSLIWIRIKVRWIHNTGPNRAGFESNYESNSSFFCRCCSGSWSYVIGFSFFTLEYIWCTKFWATSKKIQPPACSVCMCSHFFLRGIVLKKCGRDLNCSLDYSSSWVKNSIISPTKIEQHFGGFWNFETPLMLLSLSQKVVHSMIDEKFVFLPIYSEFLWYVCSLKFILHFT